MQQELPKKPVEGVDFGWTLYDREKNPDQLVVSASGIGLMMKSPKHYNWVYNLGNRKPQSKAMDDGKMIHMALLEPDKFAQTYVSIKKSDYPDALDGSAQYKARIKEINEERSLKMKVSGTNAELIETLRLLDPNVVIWDELLPKLMEGKMPISETDLEMLKAIKNSIAEHEDINYLLSTAKGTREQAFWYRHPRTGVIIHGVLDYLVPDFSGRPLFLDVKTCKSAEYEEFSRAIWNLGSYIQMAIYHDAMEFIFQKQPIGAYLAIEKTGCCPVEGYPADFGMLEQGRAVYEKKINHILECRELGKWPSYNGGKFRNISLPYFADKKLDAYAEQELEQAD